MIYEQKWMIRSMIFLSIVFISVALVSYLLFVIYVIDGIVYLLKLWLFCLLCLNALYYFSGPGQTSGLYWQSQQSGNYIFLDYIYTRVGYAIKPRVAYENRNCRLKLVNINYPLKKEEVLCLRLHEYIQDGPIVPGHDLIIAP